MAAKAEKPDKTTLFRYAVMQLPGIALAFIAAVVLSGLTQGDSRLIWSVFAIWVLKDILLFPRVWRAYQIPEKENDAMVGETGQVVKHCQPEGIVEIHGVQWQAVIDDGESFLPAGTPVEVKDRKGLTLIVQNGARQKGTVAGII